MAHELPEHYTKFGEHYPKVLEAYEELAVQCREAGPVDARSQRLIKLALAVGCGSEGAVHSHVRQALDEGLDKAQLRQVALLAIPTLGFPRAMAALSWINDIVDKR